MKTLEYFKNEVALRLTKDKRDWKEIKDYDFEYGVQLEKIYTLEQIQDIACYEYAKYIQEEIIKRCAEIASIGYDSRRPYDPYFVDKQSILNIERILK